MTLLDDLIERVEGITVTSTVERGEWACGFSEGRDATILAAVDILREAKAEAGDFDAYKVLSEGSFRTDLHMGDTFAYACADSEPIDAGDLSHMRALLEKYGHEALIAHSAVQRSAQGARVDPIAPLDTDADMRSADQLPGNSYDAVGNILSQYPLLG